MEYGRGDPELCRFRAEAEELMKVIVEEVDDETASRIEVRKKNGR